MRKAIRLFPVFFGLFLAFCHEGQAGVISMGEGFGKAAIAGWDFEYLEDRSRRLTLDAVMASTDWATNRDQIPNFGYSPSVFWFRLILRNTGSQVFPGFLEVQYPILDFVDFHVLKDKVLIKQSRSGDMLPFSARELAHKNPILPISIAPGDELLIYFRIQTQSSVQVPLLVWNERSFWSQEQLPFALQCLYFGVMLAMVVYNFFIFLSHKSISYLLYVGFVLCYAVFQISLQGFGLQFIWPENPEVNRLSLPLSICFALFFANAFAISFLRIRDYSRWLYRLLVGFAYLMLALAAVSFVVQGSAIVRIGVGLSIPVSMLCITSGLKSWRAGNPLGLYFMIAWISFLLGTILAALNKFGVIDRNLVTESTQQIGSYLEVTLLSFALAYRMNLMSKEKYLAQKQALEAQEAVYRTQKEANAKLTEKNEEIQSINRNLETIVAYRTRELKAIFDNIPQGIASLDAEGIISQNHSRHLKVALGRQELTGASILDIFAEADLSQDRLDRIRQSLKSCVGEDVLNFEVNASNFPTELAIPREAGTAHYALTWGPELTDEGIVHSLLMTIVDVTDKKRLERESEEQRTNFTLIRELVQCDPQKFETFATTAEKLWRRNAELMEETSLSQQHIQSLFVNAHTVKGGARTLKLSILADVIHEVEDQYAQILKSQQTIDKNLLKSGIQRVEATLEAYALMNREKLGRKNNSNRALTLEALRPYYELLNGLVSQESPVDVRHLQPMREGLGRLIFRTDREVIEQCFEAVDAIARELSKLPPVLSLSPCLVLLPPELEENLQNIMVHILRNAVDHGIESPDERAAKGKAPVGRIEVKSSLAQGILSIEVGDDGRGLAIRQLEEKGLRLGLISEGASIEAIAEIIFQPDISTARTVTQISGRGMGMDAIRKFMTNAGGTVNIKLLADAGDYVSFVLVMEFPWSAAPNQTHPQLPTARVV